MAALILGSLVTTIPLLSVTSAGERGPADNGWLAVVLVLVGTLCLIWRRRASLLVFAISAVAFCTGLLLGYSPALPLAPVIALYTLAVAHNSLVAAGAAGVVVALFVAIGTATQPGWWEDFDDRVFENLLLLLIACMLGYGIQLSHARRSVLMAQESRLAREHDAEKEQAIRAEKSRIARELHDVVAHHVSVMTAQAAGAQRVFDAEPDLARQALQSIETVGRGALNEMRRLLGVLQTEADDAAVAPQPGLDQLPSLLAQMRRAGLPVELRVRGDPRPLPCGVELNAFRIVQEALTNALKHAGPSRAQVELSYHSAYLDLRVCDNGYLDTWIPGYLDLRVCDNGRGFGADATPGHGLIGMRQRASLLGGEIHVRPGSDGGVQVVATLPTEASVG